MFLFQLQTGLPWWATLIIAALLVASGVLNVIQLYKSRELAQWRGAAEAAGETNRLYESELKLVRERADRLTGENEAKSKRIGVLESRTDLDSLRAQMKLMEEATSREISEGQLRVVSALQGMTTNIMEGFTKHSHEDHEFQERICTILEGIEQRMQQAA